MRMPQPADPPADDRDAPPPAAAETHWPLGPEGGAVEPAVGRHGDRPRTRPAPALSFVALPERGEAPPSMPLAAARMRFVPLDAAGEPAPDAGATVIPLWTAGWSVREQGPGRRSRPGIDLGVAATPEVAAAAPGAPGTADTPGRPGRLRLVVVGTVAVAIVVCSTAVLRHLVERRTGAPVQRPVASAAGAARVARPTATAAASGPVAQPTPGTPTPAPPTPPAVTAPAAPAPTPALSSPRATPAPTPSPRPVPAPRPTLSPPAHSPSPSPPPSPTPGPTASWEFSGKTGSANSCPGGAVAFGGCTYTVKVDRGGTLTAVVGGYSSSSLKLKIRDAAGVSLATRYVQPGQASLSLAVAAGTYRVTVQELSTQTSSFTLAVSLS
jgi:hypothetical protein